MDTLTLPDLAELRLQRIPAPRIAPRRPCPKCAGETALVAGVVLFPRSKEWHSKMALVCWDCNVVRTRGQSWSDLNFKLHQRQWKTERSYFEKET